MMKQIIQYFLRGSMIAFTISVLTLSVTMEFAIDTGVVPVTLIWQSLVLSMICSLISLVYRSEKLGFIWQSIIGYFLTLATIIICGLIFDWYGYGGNGFERIIFISVLMYSSLYLITWVVILQSRKVKKKELNNKLNNYKQKQ